MSDLNKEILGKQEQHWESAFSKRPDMFGETPSNSALKAAEIFKKE